MWHGQNKVSTGILVILPPVLAIVILVLNGSMTRIGIDFYHISYNPIVAIFFPLLGSAHVPQFVS